MSILKPRRFVRLVTDIDLAGLRAEGLELLIVDLDNTMTPRGTRELPPAVVSWLTRARDLGFELAVVSNNWAGVVAEVLERAGLNGVLVAASAGKPLPFSFRSVMRRAGVTRAKAAIVGDQVFTDVLGGNWAGGYTILVENLGGKEHLLTRLLRLLEARLKTRWGFR